MVRFTPCRVAHVRCSWILGQEQGYAGGPDPANREACVNYAGLDHPSIPMIDFLSQVVALRLRSRQGPGATH